MKVGDMVQRHDVLRGATGIVIRLCMDDYWGLTAIVVWFDGLTSEYEQADIEVISESR